MYIVRKITRNSPLEFTLRTTSSFTHALVVCALALIVRALALVVRALALVVHKLELSTLALSI